MKRLDYNAIKLRYRVTFDHHLDEELEYIYDTIKEENVTLRPSIEMLAKNIGLSETTVFRFINKRYNKFDMSLHTFEKFSNYTALRLEGDTIRTYACFPSRDYIRHYIDKMNVHTMHDMIENTGLPRYYLTRFRSGNGYMNMLGACTVYDAIKEKMGL